MFNSDIINKYTYLLTIGSFYNVLVFSGLTRLTTTRIKINITENFMLYYFINTYIIIHLK